MFTKNALIIHIIGWLLFSLFGVLFSLQAIQSNFIMTILFLVSLLLISIGLLYDKNTTS
ncbi:hypothetical protein [Metabacillus fastidiosus]|uniref:Lmo0937 family membrane protein n=1 Tax=Metabacillus fastidiosus TaxID=1458 RepID=A0ABU6NWQ9_9BACI|nr:hypothetical protein [Metabacillus fastidiosus]MED4400832.1 hypothetical protein [Metabacillus fastidiosus]MED4453593.1 hypothetical protein [Metabacillus fastidiosus]MED4463760.1 hypothetical protein [Metabacillus fastidiosus]MED4530618.1 hypothetical protein [Metabacillus fastidiosus]